MTPEVIADLVDTAGLVALAAVGALGLRFVFTSRGWKRLGCRLGDHVWSDPTWSVALDAPWKRCVVCSEERVLRFGGSEPWGWTTVPTREANDGTTNEADAGDGEGVPGTGSGA